MEQVYKLIDSVEIVSFDIFDTLILRPFVQPQDVFVYLENYFNKLGFSKERLIAERKAKILALAKNKKEDCSIDEIYRQIKPEYKDLKNYEINFEKQIATLNKEMFEVYQYALKQNKKIIFSSDMYLDKNTIEEILNNNKILKYEDILISSELGISKAGKSLYKYIVSKYNVNPAKILHIGDNEVADIENAKEQSLITYQYIPPIIQFFNQPQNTRLKNFYKNNKENSVISFLIGMQVLNSKNNENYWFNLGYNVGAILAISLTLNAIKIAKEKNLTDLYFISRDAFFPKEIFDTLNNDKNIKSHYVILNRVLKHKYKNSPKGSNNELYRYLTSIKTNGNKIGIVDTSAGTFSAQELLQDYLQDKQFLGIYLHTRKNEIYDYINLSNITLDEVKKMFNLNFIEILLTSLEPKIEDIKDFKPVYETDENKYEVEKRNYYKSILAGERAFVKMFSKLFKDFYINVDVNLIYQYLSNFWNNLTDEDKKYLASIKNSVDTQQTMYVSLINDKQDIAAQLRQRLQQKLIH